MATSWKTIFATEDAIANVREAVEELATVVLDGVRRGGCSDNPYWEMSDIVDKMEITLAALSSALDDKMLEMQREDEERDAEIEREEQQYRA